MNNKYLNFLNWAVFTMIDRKTQDDLERFEEFYNFIQDLNEKYCDYAIFHVKDGNFTVDEENKFRYMLHIWTDTKIRGVDMF